MSIEIAARTIPTVLETAGEQERPATLSIVRERGACYLASQNVNQPNVEDHVGWTRGSKIAARYVAISGPQNEREISKAYGADVEDEEPDPIAPIECYRCKRETPRDKDRCMWCGQVLTPAAIERVQKDEGEIRRGC